VAEEYLKIREREKHEVHLEHAKEMSKIDDDM
jgi:hypothetical protein